MASHEDSDEGSTTRRWKTVGVLLFCLFAAAVLVPFGLDLIQTTSSGSPFESGNVASLGLGLVVLLGVVYVRLQLAGNS